MVLYWKGLFLFVFVLIRGLPGVVYAQSSAADASKSSLERECYSADSSTIKTMLGASDQRSDGTRFSQINQKCDHIKMLKEGKNLNFVYQKQNQKKYQIVSQKFDDAKTDQEKAQVLADLKKEQTCFQEETEASCVARFKRSLTEADIYSRERNLTYNSGIKDVFLHESQTKVFAPTSEEENSKASDENRNGMLKDFFDLSKKTPLEKAVDPRYAKIYSMDYLKFDRPKSGEVILNDSTKPNGKYKYEEISKDKFNFADYNSSYANSEAFKTPVEVSNGTQDQDLKTAVEKISKRSSAAYLADRTRLERGEMMRLKNGAVDPKKLQQTTDDIAFRETMLDVDCAVIQADAELSKNSKQKIECAKIRDAQKDPKRRIASKLNGIYEVDRNIQTGYDTEIETRNARIFEASGDLKKALEIYRKIKNVPEAQRIESLIKSTQSAN